MLTGLTPIQKKSDRLAGSLTQSLPVLLDDLLRSLLVKINLEIMDYKRIFDRLIDTLKYRETWNTDDKHDEVMDLLK